MKLPNDLKKLDRTAIVQAGDIQIYADGSLGDGVMRSEVGMTVAQTGYFGVARRRPTSRKNKLNAR